MCLVFLIVLVAEKFFKKMSQMKLLGFCAVLDDSESTTLL